VKPFLEGKQMTHELMPPSANGQSGLRSVVAESEQRAASGDGNGQAIRIKRVTAVLPGGRSVTLTCENPNLEQFIRTLEELAAKARKVRPRGIELSTFVRMLRDEARA
jgi:hypothetical protein